MSKDAYLRRVLGEERFNRIRNSTVLMVGAGGIGCELLKDLVLTGYKEIHIVDLDTVTLSNLNRQFLFRQKDIDKSKSLTITKAVEKFNYFGCKLIPHHGNIMDTDAFPISWWSGFDYIYNALDNLEARRYVNKICLFTKKPLMESGTTGFQGQVQPIYPYHSECFDCQAKVTPTTFPVCTIRSTPSKPAHSIIWAKEFLFHQLFEKTETLSALEREEQRKQLETETDDKEEVENLLNEANELSDLKLLLPKGASVVIPELMSKVFVRDIERLLRIESLWKQREPPSPLNLASFRTELQLLLSDASVTVSSLSETQAWSVVENIYVLQRATERLAERIVSESIISFDKDDEDTLDFVVAAANLRSFIFHIPLQSKFDIKQIAGNIIPAVATTNAIISGLSDLESLEYFKTLDSKTAYQNSSTVFISMQPNKYLTGASVVPPNKTCASCSLSSKGVLTVSQEDLKTLKLSDLVNKIGDTYTYEEFSLVLGSSKLIYDFDFEDNLDKPLEAIGFKFGETLLVQDEDDKVENLELYINSGELGLPAVNLRPKIIIKPPTTETEDTEDNDVTINDDSIVIDEDDVIELEETDQPPTKKQRI